MDSSFTSVKFSDIISFDLFVAFKPLFSSLNQLQKQTEQENNNNILTQSLLPLDGQSTTL